MATTLSTVYDCFLSKVEADDWMLSEDISQELLSDWNTLLNSAIMSFKYPRISLEHDDTQFTNTLSNSEVQILANYMKLEWMRRCVATWDNLRQLYSDKDFQYSNANFLDKLLKASSQTEKECRQMVDNYSRSYNYKPDEKFGQLAGK